MGTRKTYALFTISQDNKIDEIYDCGKYLSLTYGLSTPKISVRIGRTTFVVIV